jgi:predicted metal-dependent hydrolase
MSLRATGTDTQLGLDFEGMTPVAPVTGLAVPPPPLRPGERQRCVATSSAPLDYRLRRARRRTIGFLIDDAGLTISAPRWVTLREIEAAILEKERWIRRKLGEWRALRATRAAAPMRFVDGAQLPYLGGTLSLRAGTGASVSHCTDSTLHLALPAQASEAQVRDAVQAWLQGEARRVIGARIGAIAQRLPADSRVPLASWALSSARSQWGSCTHDGRVRLNWRLIHFSPAIIDYVIAHELAHLRELNHSRRFWKTLAELLPGYETACAEIKGVDIAALPL